jgi:hypothetical protein
MFFMLSGALLYKNNSTISSYKSFFIKRWKSIFPMFYIAYLFFYIPKVIKSGTLFYLGNPSSFLLSVFGMDGYFLYKIPNYYLIGEWFLGAIILLYILYPICLKASVKPAVSTIIIICLYIWQVYTDFFIIDSGRNFISCLISFWFGILFMKYYENLINILNKKTFVALCLLLLPLLFVRISFLNKNITEHIVGYILFILFFSLGNIVMKNNVVNKICISVSHLSYGIFLVHHRILYKLLLFFSSLTVLQYTLLLFAVYLICAASAFILIKLCMFIMRIFSKNHKISIASY